MLALAVAHSAEGVILRPHSLMFVYRNCKAGDQECFTVLLVVSSTKGSLRQPFGVGREKAPVTATSGDACFQEKV